MEGWNNGKKWVEGDMIFASFQYSNYPIIF